MQRRRGLRVLVVGDNQQYFVKRLMRTIEEWGHEVELAHDGISALQSAWEALPDVVFLGLPLPGQDGFTLARRIQRMSNWRRPMVVTVGRKADREASRQSREAGIDLHLVEPIAPERLHRFLRRFQAVLQDTEDFSPVI